jgi:hypothetical protein
MGACRPVGYVPRQTATRDFRRIVAEHLPAFLERIEHDGMSLPAFVAAELAALRRLRARLPAPFVHSVR